MTIALTPLSKKSTGKYKILFHKNSGLFHYFIPAWGAASAVQSRQLSCLTALSYSHSPWYVVRKEHPIADVHCYDMTWENHFHSSEAIKVHFASVCRTPQCNMSEVSITSFKNLHSVHFGLTCSKVHIFPRSVFPSNWNLTDENSLWMNVACNII